MFYRDYANLSDIPEPFRGKTTHNQPHNKAFERINTCGVSSQAKKNNSQDMVFILLILMLLME